MERNRSSLLDAITRPTERRIVVTEQEARALIEPYVFERSDGTRLLTDYDVITLLMEQSNSGLKELIENYPIEACQACENVGYYAQRDRNGDPEQEQCEFCYNAKNSLFNLNQLIAELEKGVKE